MVDKVVENDLMFFYGSLQRGEYPYKHLELASMLEFVDAVTYSGELRDMGQYPACKPGGTAVQGELFKVRDVKVAAILDHFERFDETNLEQSLYLRERITLVSGVQAWTYLYNQDFSDQPVIESGDWLAYKKATQRADFKGFTD